MAWIVGHVTLTVVVTLTVDISVPLRQFIRVACEIFEKGAAVVS